MDFWELEKKLPHFLLKLDYVRLCGDLPTGALLSQVAYWFRPDKHGKSKLRVDREGRSWVAKTREEWAQECGITDKQYRRSIQVLQDMELVASRVWLFQGRTCVHLWLDIDRLCLALSAIPGVPFGPSSIALSAIPYKEENTSESTTEIQEGRDVNADEILKGMQTRKPQTGTGIKSLEIVWKKTLGRETESYVKPLTGKEVGQLKHVHKALGEKAVETLEWALTNWQAFTYAVSEAKGIGVQLIGAQPTCGFFCLHYDVAVQSIAGKKAKPVQATKLDAIVKTPVSQGKIEEQPATQQEIQAALDALQSAAGGGAPE